MSQGNFGGGFSSGCGFMTGAIVCLGVLSMVLCLGCFGGLGVVMEGARQEREEREQREAIERAGKEKAAKEKAAKDGDKKAGGEKLPK